MATLGGTTQELCYLKHHLIRHGEGAVQFPCQTVDLLLQMFGVHQDLKEDTSEDTFTCGQPSKMCFLSAVTFVISSFCFLMLPTISRILCV